MEGRPPSTNHRASFALLLGLLSTLTMPGAIAVAQRSPTVGLLDAAWGIPVGLGLGALSLAVGNLARTRAHWSAGRAGGLGRTRFARSLAVAGISLALAAGVSVLFYEILRRYKH